MISVQPETIHTNPSATLFRSNGALNLISGGRSLKTFLLTLLFVVYLAPELSGQWLTGYGFRKLITIPAASVSGAGTHTNFPVLIDLTDADLESVSNGGLVESDNGWDIAFSQDHSTALNHEIEDYDAVNGQIIAWVQIPSLDATSDNTLYLYFGNSSVVADPSTTDTWDPAAYVAVYHLHDDFIDATANTNNGTNIGTTNLAGQIADGEDFQQIDNQDRIELGDIQVTSSALTISAWVAPSVNPYTDSRIVSKANGSSNPNHWWMLSAINSTRLRFRLRIGGTTSVYQPTNNVLIEDGSWQYVSAVYDGSNMNLAYNGSTFGPGLANTGAIDAGATVNAAIGNQPDPFTNGYRTFNGTIDEVRIQSVARSDAWLTTEYNNQFNPGGFFTDGATEIVNDFPCRALELPINECYTPEVYTNVTSTKSGVPDPSCGNYGPDDICGDVWFKVEVPANGKIAIEVDTEESVPPWGFRMAMEVFSGTCNGLVSEGCYENNSYLHPRTARAVFTGLTSGDSLFIRVWEQYNNQPGFFRISAMNDVTDPVISNCPADISQSNDAGECEADVTWTAPTANDNCTAVGDLVWGNSHDPGDTFPVGTTTVTYYVVDLAGDTAFCTFDVEVTDDENPTITCPGDLTAECDISEQPSYANYAAFVAAGGSASDNCGIDASSFTHVSDVSDGLSCPETITRTYQISDNEGNSSTCQQLITIDDDTDPTASNPAAVNVQCIGDVPAPDITVVTDEADNCTAAPVVAFVSDVSDGNTCPEVITRTYSVTDDCSNSITVTQTITVDDDTDPTASNPAAVNVQCIGDVPAPDITVVTDEADNCTAAPVVAFVSDVSDGNTCPEVITRTYSVTDDCSNSITVTQTITVDDDTDPTASNPAAVNVQCIGDVPAPDITVVTDEADNCTAAPVVAFVSDVSDGNTCPEVITRTYSVTDDCSNSITVTQTITVDDDTDPTASNPVAVNVQCAADVPVPDVTVVTDEADNCTAAPVVAFVSDVSDGNTCPEVITRTYSVTDDCSNSITVTQTITVDDDTDPTASNPAAVNVQCIGDVPVPDVTVVTDEADNCTAAPVVAFVSDVSDGNTCPEVITRTYSVTDDCSNSITVTQTITVDDDTDPTASNPAAVNVQCIGDVPVPDVTVVTDEADNCTAAPVVAFVSDVSDGNTCPEVITRTYSVTDDCSNSITVTQTITVDDDTDPTASNPAAVNVQCIGDVPAPDITVVTDEADNCTAAPVVAFVSDVSDGNTCPEVITRTYSVTDDCSNSITVTQTITVDDDTDPTASNPAAVNVQCIGDVPVPDVTVVIDEADNCTAAPVVAFVSDVSDGNTCPEVITRTYSVTDDCSNSITVTQTITVDDDTDPTASNPAAVNVQCIGDVPAPDITVVTDEADNCTAAPVVAFVSDVSDGNTCPEVITRTYSVTDDCSNSITVTQTITVDDDTDPTASNPAAVNVQCIGDVPAPDITVVTDEADNCTAAPVVAFVSDVSDGNTCPEVITRTYSVTDDCSNSITVTQTITVDDDTDPTASNPAAVNVQCIGDVPAPDITVVTDEADNCTAAPVVAFVSDVSDGNTCPEVITRTYSVTDDCSNSITVTQTITVDDDTDPTASNPAAVNVQCIGDVPAPDITVVTDEADNCTAAPVVAFVSDVSDGNTCPEVITRTYSVTDDCSNSITVTQTITVDDDTDPTASNPAAVNVQCLGDVPVPDVTVVIDEADNCTAAPVVAFVSDVSDGNTCPEVITRTYSVTDDCSNSITVTQTITVDDDTDPTASNPAAVNVQCIGDVPVPDVTVVIDEADNCTAAPVVAFVSDVSDGNTCPEVITRTYSVTDDCSNSITVTQTITVDDDTDPTASNPAAVNVQCIGDVPAPDVTVVTDEADNCTAAPVVAFVSDVSDGNTCPEVITRTYSVTDDCSNSITVTQTITVDDDTDPTASNPAAVNVQCIGDVPVPDVTVVTDEADNCTAAPVVAFVSDVSDGNTCPEVITRTYSVTDDCSNSITVTQTITVDDDTDPTASNPAAVNVQCIGDVPVPDVTVVIDEADNCTAAPVVAFVSDVSDGNTCPEVITRTYSVTDDCSNSITVTQTITVDDDTDPTASNPAAVNVQCIGDVPAPDITVVTDEADNCTAAPVVAFVSDVSDGNTCPEVITRTYSVTDDCSNSITVTQTITVDDDTDPTASNPAAVNVQCIGDVPVPDVTVVIDEADNCTAAPVVAFVSDVSDGNTCPEVITRTYSVTDDCSNSITVTQTITVDDDTDPTASNPAAVNVQCIGDVPAPDITVVTDEADNCTAAPVVAFVSDVSDGNTCPEVITRTYSVTDDCSNSITVTQTITVDDDTDPTASNPAAVNVQCIGDVPAPDITVVTDEADNCTAAPVVAFVSDVSDGNTCPEVITRTYSVTDDCSNSITVTQTITVDDDTDPTASNPAAVNVQCIGDVPVPDVTVVTDEADNCTAAPVVAFVSDVSDGNTCPEVITRTYSVTDDCSNSITVTQTITVDDDTDPTASNPAAVNVQCIGDVPAPDITVVTDEADNCTAAPVVAFVSDVSDGNTCPEVITRTYSVTDDCSNSITVTQTITVDDDTDPTASNPVAVNVQCAADVPVPDVTVVTDEADNCTAAPVVAFVSDVSDGNTCPEVITRTYSVTDDCSNSITVTQTITVDDDTDPTASNPAAVNVQCIGDVPVPDVTVVIDEADNCTAAPVVAFVSDVSDGNTCPEVITRTYSVTDDCSNSITVTQTITVDDDTDPTASNPAAVNVQCIGDVPAPDITVVTDEADNCTAAPVVAFVSDVSDGNTCPEVITRTYSVTDDCSNQILVTQTITVDDDTDPTASNPVAVNVQCAADVPVPDVTVVTDEADNCTAAPVVAFVSDVSDGNTCPEVITRTYSVTDDCSNSITVTQTITVDDDTDPTASNPAAVNVQCIGDVPVPDVTVVIDEADNCTAAPVVAFVSDVSDGNTCPEVITRTYSVTDDCSNSITVTQTITVDDDTDPTASNPAAVNVQCIGDVPAPDITVVTDEADNCTAAPVVAFVSDVSDGNTCPEVITRTYSVTDDCSNSITVTQTITVDDDTDPTASNPAAVNVQCIGDVPVPDVTVVTDEADNCTAAPVVAFVSDVSDGNTCPEVITRTYSVTDDCSNSITVTQTITVDDDTDPTASNPAAVNVQCIGDVPAPDITVVTDEADNCTAAPVVAFVSDVSDGNTCPEVITRTYSVTDDCSNSITVTQTITVDDDTDPTASNPVAVNVQCAADVPVPDVTVVTDEADNCTAAPVVAFVSDVSDGNTCPEVITRTYSVTDDCSNSITVTQTITVDDDTDPTASNPAAVNVQCIGDVPVPDVTVVTDEADNCTAAPVVAFVSDVSDGNTCPEVITRTYSVTDDCSNSITVTQTITVDDDTDPTASNPAAVNVQCIGDVPAPDITVVTDEADNCTAAPVVAFVSDVSDGNTCPEVITRTYSVTDDCSNSITVTQTITVDDDTDPTASNPAAVNVQCIGDVPAPDITVVTDEADNCTAAPVVAFVSDVSDGNTCPEVITRTYSVTDDCSNSITVTQTITVDDDTDPTASNPAAVNVQCIGDVPAPDITVVTDEADNCTAAPVVAFVSDVSDGNTCPEVITRTYSVTDDCSNSITVTQTITVDDDTDPTASNPAAVNVQCIGDVPVPDVTVVTDEADNCTAAPVVAFVSDVSDGNTCPEVITRTYSVTDDCSNSITVTQTITVDDDTDPTASNPAAVNVQCIGDVPAPDITVVTDEADNCTAAPVVAFVSDVSDGNTCPEVITRTYSVTDDCSNSITVTQTITVDDDTDPTASNPAAVNVQCIGDVPAPDITVVTDEADNCTAAPVVAFVSDVSDGNTCPEVITRTYSVTDDCSNSITVTQTITIDDTIDPIFTVPANETICRNLDCSYDIDPSVTGDVIDEWDNCSAPIEATFVDDFTNLVSCDVAGYVIRTWTLEDACNNSVSQQQTIWIEPVPTVIPVTTDTIQCDSAFTNIQLTSPSVFTAGNITFDYTVTASGAVTGFSTPVSGLPLDHIIADQLINHTNTVQTVTYNITPVNPTACPNGVTQAVTIYVNPTPRFSVSSPDTVVCDGSTVDLDVTDATGNVEGAKVYELTRTYNPADITVITGQPDGEYYLSTDDISDQLINNTDLVQPITYHLVARIRDDRVGYNFGYCDHGIDTTITIWVNPTPNISVEASDSVLCNGDTTILTVTNPNTSIRGNWLYDLVVDPDPEITGNTVSQSGVTTPSFTDILTNSDSVVRRVTYHFSPRIDPDDDGDDCENGRDTTIVIWVNPTPRIRVSADTVICNGETSIISISNPNDPIRGLWNYDLDVVAEAEIGGESGSGIDLSALTLSETLTNSDTVAHYVDYTFTPKIYNDDGAVDACVNGDTTIRIWVNPTPEIRVEADTVICSGETATITIRNPNVPSRGTWMYNLVVTADDDIEGESSDYIGTTLGTLNETLINHDTIVRKVEYHFIPWISPADLGLECGGGRDTLITVWVNPTPEIRVNADSVICSDGTAVINVANPNNPIRGSWTYDLVVTPDPGITGAVASQAGITTTVFNETLTNTTTEAQKVEYHFTPWIHPDDLGADCGGGRDTTVTVWVNPIPRIEVDAPDTVLCNDEDVNFEVKIPNTTAHGEWKYNLTVDYGAFVTGTGIGGEYTDGDLNLVDHLVNNDTAAHRISYRFTPRITPGDMGSDCGSGVDTTIYIWVNPTPEIRVSTPNSIICNEDLINLFIRNPNVPTMGDWKYNLIVDYGTHITGLGIGGEYDATDVVLSDQLTNTDTLYHFVSYHFTPRISPVDLDPDCENGLDTTIIVWVNPTPAIRVYARDSILCNGDSTHIWINNPNSFIGGHWEYNLVVNPDPEISGSRPSIDGIIDTLIIDPLINNDTVVHKVEYTFTPTKTPDPDICAGGNDTTIVIWVNPTPEVRVTVSDTVLCDGDSVTLELRNPNVPIRGIWDGTLEITVDPGITGVTAGPIPFSGDAVYNYTLGNISDQAQSVTYRFMPRIRDDDGDWCNNGIDTTIVVWVNPVPDIVVVASDTLICNEEVADFKINSLNPYVRGEWYYELEVTPDPEITGARAGSIYPIDSISFQDLLINTDTAVHKVTYRFIPRIGPSDFDGDCENGRDTTITIWVNPTPRILVGFPDTIFCNNDTAVISVDDGLGIVYGVKEYTVTAVYGPGVNVISRASGSSETLLSGTPITDIYVNNTLAAQPVDYTFTPRIRDIREGHIGEFCYDGDITIRIWINPTPGLDVDVPDTIICDNSTVEINISSPQGSLTGGTLVYDLVVTYNPVDVSGTITGDGEWLPPQSISDLLINNSDTVQLISYHFTARIRDDRPGYEGSFCSSGSDTTIYIYLNPVPILDYTLLEDSLCYDDGFTIVTDSLARATHPLYFELVVTNDNGLTNVIDPAAYGDTLAVANSLDQTNVLNPHTGYGRLTYNILPFISTEGCLGTDTTFIIDVNPEPRMTAQLSRPQDTAVCFDQGYLILMNEPIDSTTGNFVYDLNTYGYTEPNVDNERLTGDYVIENMDQTTVINNGEFIEDITYRYIPVIRNVNGQGKDCPGTAYDSITVQVAPELRGLLEPDTIYVGGHAVRCYGLEDVLLHSNVRGGYYRNPYEFDWYTNGGSAGNMVPDDSVQINMGIGEYWFDVVDVIGCAFGDTLLVTQPDTIEAPAVIVDATCLADNRNDGSIDISPVGGIQGYSYQWTGPFGYNSTDEDVLTGTAGPYRLTLNDTNRCEIRDIFWIGSAEVISIDTTITRYGNYEITCNGENTGEIFVRSIVGGFPGYTLVAVDQGTGDTVYNQPVAQSGGIYSATISGLSSGDYRLWAYDTELCYNENQGEITNFLREPDTISISRLPEDIQVHHDTVDVSCFGADDGFINLAVTGGHTADYKNEFTWTGPPGETDLVQDDSLQSALSGGLYSIYLRDFWGCEQWADYTLFEPTQIMLDVDSLRELNGWNITCFGDNDGFIEISSSGGIESHDYLWSPGSMTLPDPTQQDIYDLVADTFHLTITDSIGCTLDTVFELIQPNLLGVDTIIPRINEWEIACADDSSGSITLIPLGGADSLNNTYLWSTDIGNLGDPASMNQAGLREGNYTVLVTDINGCTFMETYELLDPDPIVIDTFMVDSAFCHGSATGAIDMIAYGGVDPFSYMWSNGEPTEDIDSLLAGVYTIIITDDNGCILTDSAEVFEADRFGVQLIVVSDYHGAVISCADGSDGVINVDTLGGTPPYNYAWNTGATTRNLVNVPAGTYSLVVIDKHGCIDSARVDLDDPLPIDYSMQLQDPLCYGDATGQIEFLITGGTIYTVDDYEVWVNDILAGRVAGNLPEGIHQIRIEDLNDCFVETEAELIDPDSLTLTFETEEAFCRDRKDGEMDLYIDGGIFPYDISWNMDLPDNEDSFNELYSGEYVATITDAHQCVKSDTVYVGYTYESCLVIPNAFSPNGDGFNDQWLIEGLELYPNAEIRIFDRWGSRVYYSPNAVDDPWNGTFDGRRLPIDSYHYIIDLENGDPAITGNVTIVR